MTGIEVNTVSNVNTPALPVSSNAPAQESIRRTSEVKAENAVKEQPKVQPGEELDHVVARSKDGDTVQVSDDGATELEESLEGAVIAESTVELPESRVEFDFEIEAPEIELPELEKPEVVVYDDTADVNAEPPFGKYTTQQLEMMYQQGAISAYNYNAELERRESIREAAMGENEAFTEEMAALSETASRIEQVNFAIEIAVQSDSKIDLNDRLKVVDAAAEKTKDLARMSEEEGRLWDYQLRA